MTFRVTEQERQVIEGVAAYAHAPPATWLRQVVLGEVARVMTLREVARVKKQEERK